MREQDTAIKAIDALQRVVEHIRDDQWDMTMPDDFQRRATDQPPTLREIINYHSYDDAWIPDMVAGRTMDEVGADTHKGDLLGDDPTGNFVRIAGKGRDAIAALSDADLDRTAHLSFGDFPVREYLWQVISFRGLRAYDIAKVIGIDPTLPDDLVQGMWEFLAPHAEEWRAIGVYGPRVDVPADAPLQDQVLAITGRKP